MNRIQRLFQEKKEGILNIYFTAGHPGLNDTEDIIIELDKAGVDLVEVGMPYSDPLADGETIQKSSSIALKNGMHLDLLFEQIKSARQKTDIPMVMMGYYNQVLQYGPKKFINRCSDAGVDGLILPDLPLFEFEEKYKDIFEAAGLGISFLVTPKTETHRIQKIDEVSKGFIYMVSTNATTGGEASFSNEQLDYFQRMKGLELQNPRLIGFGISSKKGYDAACSHSNGAIIGSAFIRALENGQNLSSTIHQFVNSIKNG